jgi:hypothetical protein
MPSETELIRKEFDQLSNPAKISAFNDWIQNDLFLVVLEQGRQNQNNTPGLYNLGLQLKDAFAEDQNPRVENLTFTNTYFHRSGLESKNSSPLSGLVLTGLYAHSGSFELAGRCAGMYGYFDKPDNLSDILMEQLRIRLDAVLSDLDKDMETGMAFYEREDYPGASNYFAQVLSMYPKSAGAIYEKYYSESQDMMDRNVAEKAINELWAETKTDLFLADPFYPADALPESAEEAFKLYRRQELNTLFMNVNNYNSDFREFGLIAMDIEQFGIAAELYRMLMSRNSNQNQESTVLNYIYCLQQLGQNETTKYFNEAFNERAKEVGEANSNRMLNSKIYQSFE